MDFYYFQMPDGACAMITNLLAKGLDKMLLPIAASLPLWPKDGRG